MSETINQRIAKCRRLADLTQGETAEKLGMKCSTYSQMERKGKITAEMALKLAEIFNVLPEVILYGENQLTILPINHPVMPDPANPSTPDEAPPVSDGPQILHSPIKEPKFKADPSFIFSKQEENLIKILRTLKKSDVDEIKDLINKKIKNR